MSEKEEKILYMCTHGEENLDKASIPFVLANGALAMDIKATVILQGQGVYLAKQGFAQHVMDGGGFPPINKLLNEFMELGGLLKVCVPCLKARRIDESDLVAGAETTAAGALNVEAIEADAVFVY